MSDISLVSKDGLVFLAPAHLCCYLAMTSGLVECIKHRKGDGESSNKHRKADDENDVVLEHCSHRSLAFIFEFLQYHHTREPHLTIAQSATDDESERNRQRSKLNRPKRDVLSQEKAGTHAKEYNSRWFQRVVASGVNSLYETVRAAHFLYNEYLFCVLVSGCETLILQGTAEHVRLFLQLGCSSKRREADVNEVEESKRMPNNKKRKLADICLDTEEEHEWIDWYSETARSQ